MIDFCLIRGGSWLDDPWGCRSAYRGSLRPNDHIGVVGFRVCCPLQAGDHTIPLEEQSND